MPQKAMVDTPRKEEESKGPSLDARLMSAQVQLMTELVEHIKKPTPTRAPSPPKEVPFEVKHADTIDSLVEITNQTRNQVIHQLRLANGDYSKAFEALFELMPKKHSKFDITGRMIQALRALQQDPTFFTKIKNIAIIKEDSKEPQKMKSSSSQKQSNLSHYLQNYFPVLDKDSTPEDGKTKQIGWWSYFVKKDDLNFDDRTDKVDNFMDFDSDQNYQIEMHYLECK